MAPVVDLELEEAADLRVNPGVSPRVVHLPEEHLQAMEVADRHQGMAEVEELAELVHLADHHRVTVVAARLADHHRVTVGAVRLVDRRRVTVAVV